jgi:acetoin utilization deacetylase AcuC-like enzyme
MTRELKAVADACCHGRIVAAVEGGYDLQALGGSLDAALEALNGAAAPWPASGIASNRGHSAASDARAALRNCWRFAD